MITYKDIKNAINTLLIKEFKIKINSNDVKKGFARPSFFVSFDNMGRDGDTSQVHKSLTIRINYFPSDRDENSIELMDVNEQLGNLFDLKLPVLDRFFNIDEPKADVIDGVLEFSFDIEFFDARENEYGTDPNHKPELMQNLEFRKGDLSGITGD
ncbi:phage tail terminator family protein [Bacillus sp. JJ722]|uniref:phage tail terminator family protein n=1 Tax=Bacillus sp. JJ722 TaxID=3122973 RepID=UPI002FFFF843